MKIGEKNMAHRIDIIFTKGTKLDPEVSKKILEWIKKKSEK